MNTISTLLSVRSAIIMAAVCITAAAGTEASAAPFTPENLAVVRFGDGTQTLANTGNTIFIDEYTTNGALVQSIAIPDSGVSALIASGTATSEGALMRSPNGRWLTFAGYSTNRPTAVSISGIASALVPRGVGTMDAAGNYTLAATTSSQFSGNNIRSGASDGTNNFWGAGGNSGTYYLGLATAAVAVQTTNQTNTRVNQIQNGNLYFATGSGTRGIYGYSGTPTAPAMTNFFVGTGGSSSPYGFALSPAGTILYIADDTASAAGGIQRWNLSAGVWSLAYTLATGVASIGARGLVVDWSGPDPILHATTGEAAANRLIRIVDTGAASTATTLATAGANKIFRGLAFTPVAAPTISAQPQNVTTTSGSTANFSVSASGFGSLGYQWRKGGENLTGQTASTLALDNVSAGAAGNYDVVITNSVFAVTSSVAALVVSGTPPSIAADPAGATIECTSNVTFSVAATGDVPLAYQWRRNGTEITGENNSTLSLTTVSFAQAGNYTVVITNASGSITSAPAALVVQDTFPPVITLLGANPLTLQIHTSFTDPGATALDGCEGNLSSSINISGVVDVDTAGSYTVTYTVSDGFNSTSASRTVNVVNELPPVLVLPANIFTLRTNVAGNAVNFTATATNHSGGDVPVACTPASGSIFPLGVNTVTCVADAGMGNTNSGTFTVTVASANIVVNSNSFAPYFTDLAPGAKVYVDADVAAGSPVRATQRALGYREVDYKSLVFGTLAFSPVTPTTNGANVNYDYSTQGGKSATVGAWADKNVPILIGPDGLAYITDGHHTTAGYLAPSSPVRAIVPGQNRVIIGHIVANYYNPLNPQPPDDAWWTARAAENNAFLYGTNGNQLTLPGEPNYANLQPIFPSVVSMPGTPSALGPAAMVNSDLRGLMWGLADGVVKSGIDAAGAKIAGFKKSAPGSSADINFVEFYWADFLRNRVVWDDSKTGSPYGSANGDANVVRAPLSFFAAVANGIALAKSEAYRDQYGRSLLDYTNSALFSANTVNWANGSRSNGLAAAGSTFNLYLLDDSTIAGDIAPSAVSTNILHIDTTVGMTVANAALNLKRLLVNAGWTLPTTWKDTTVSNSVLSLQPGTGDVTFSGTAAVTGDTTISNGAFIVNGTLNGGGTVNVWGGSLRGSGTINGAVSILAAATLAPGNSIGTLTINGPLTLSGTTSMEISKTGAMLSSDRITGVAALTYGGALIVTATGDALAEGDTFQLFGASSYTGTFASENLPSLDAGLAWNTLRLGLDGTISVVALPAITLQPMDTTVECQSAAHFAVAAAGTPPLSYQWRRNGGDITGATDSSLTVALATSAAAGAYTVVVGNGGGSVTSSVAVLTVTDSTAPTLSLPANITVARASNAGTTVNYVASANDACEGSVAVTCTPASGSTFPRGITTVSCEAHDSANNTNTGAFTITVQEVTIVVTNRVYSPYRTDLTGGTYVYVDSDVAAGSPVRATQRALGYREVDYKSQVPATLFFSQATPTTNAGVIAYDYSGQASKTNQVGFWVDKDVPMIIGPDGNAYITDGHHTTAGYLSPNSPVRQFVPGQNRVILGHVVANYFNPLNPQPPDDSWWTARAAENNAYLYGTNGNALTQPGAPDYANLQPILPSVLAMPNTPSSLGAGAMLNSTYRSLTWGLADGILKSAFDRAGAKIVGYKKSAPGSSVDINFVEFYWADFLRNRIVWDNNKQGSPFGSPNGDASVTAAPLSFFAAVANGIALAKSEVYRDQYGRLLRDYTNNALFAANTVNWANGSYSNGLAAPSNTFNLFLLDDSTIVGDIAPSALSTNILRVNTTAGMTVTNTIFNITKLLINGGTRIATTWKDATVTNTTLTFPGGSGDVTLAGVASVSESTTISNGAFIVTGALNGGGTVNVWGGSLRGNGTINGAVVVTANGTLAPGNSIGTLTINGPLTLSGTTAMEINKSGTTLTSDHIVGVTALTYGGTLTVSASGDALAEGDAFQLFGGSTYGGSFTTFSLPLLGDGLEWDTARLATDGVIRVKLSNRPPTAHDHGAAIQRDHVLTLALTTLLADATDPDGDALAVTSVSATSTNGGTVVLSVSAVTYTPQPGFTGVDRFTYTIADGHGGTASASVEVLVVTGNLPAENMVSLTSSGGGFLLRFAGIPGQAYDIQRTATLVPADWVTVATMTTPLHGIIEFLDSNPPLSSAFYRTAVH